MKQQVLATAMVLALTAGPAAAASITWNAEFEFSESGDSISSANAIQLTLSDAVGGGVDFSLTGAFAAGEFLSGLYLNFDPSKALIDASNFTNESGVAPESLNFGTNAFKADGDGDFDILLEFSTNPPRFDNNDTLTYLITGVTVADFNFLSVDGPEGKTGFPVAFRVQGLGANNEGSGWFTDREPVCDPSPCDDPDPDPVPEPTSLILLGIGSLAGAAIVRRRRVS